MDVLSYGGQHTVKVITNMMMSSGRTKKVEL